MTLRILYVLGAIAFVHPALASDASFDIAAGRDRHATSSQTADRADHHRAMIDHACCARCVQAHGAQGAQHETQKKDSVSRDSFEGHHEG